MTFLAKFDQRSCTTLLVISQITFLQLSLTVYIVNLKIYILFKFT